MRNGRLAGVDRAVQVDGHAAVPVGTLVILALGSKIGAGENDPGAAHQNVQPSVPIYCRPDGVAHAGAVGDIKRTNVQPPGVGLT